MNVVCLSFRSQIFRSLESPAEEDLAHKLHMNVVQQRAYFVSNIATLMNMSDLRNREHAVSSHLEKYELVCYLRLMHVHYVVLLLLFLLLSHHRHHLFFRIFDNFTRNKSV